MGENLCATEICCSPCSPNSPCFFFEINIQLYECIYSESIQANVYTILIYHGNSLLCESFLVSNDHFHKRNEEVWRKKVIEKDTKQFTEYMYLGSKQTMFIKERLNE